MSEDFWAMFGTIQGGDDEISPPACMERALTYLSEPDQRKFRKVFKNRSGVEDQKMHMFFELLAAPYLAGQGFTPHYSPAINGLTPDWHLTRDVPESSSLNSGTFKVPKRSESSSKKLLMGMDRDYGTASCRRTIVAFGMPCRRRLENTKRLRHK